MNDLAQVLCEAGHRGYYARSHKLLEVPEHWGYIGRKWQVYAQQDCHPDTLVPRVEVGYIAGAERPAAIALLHEIGHARQCDAVGGTLHDAGYKQCKATRWELEADAWAEAMVIADDIGLGFGVQDALFALTALSTYIGDPTDALHPTYQTLETIAYG
jgi:hypothetical protein